MSYEPLTFMGAFEIISNHGRYTDAEIMAAILVVEESWSVHMNSQDMISDIYMGLVEIKWNWPRFIHIHPVTSDIHPGVRADVAIHRLSKAIADAGKPRYYEQGRKGRQDSRLRTVSNIASGGKY